MSKYEELLECARAWEPGARLLGNVTAATIAEICLEAIQLRADLERVTAETELQTLVKARADLDQLRRAWALWELERRGSHCIAPPEEWLARLPESVAGLIRAGAGKPIGECELCVRKAPLVQKVTGGLFDDGRGVCAHGWPCKS